MKNVEFASVDTFTTSCKRWTAKGDVKSTNVYVHCIKHGSLSINIGDKWIYVDPVTDKVQPPCVCFPSVPVHSGFPG